MIINDYAILILVLLMELKVTGRQHWVSTNISEIVHDRYNYCGELLWNCIWTIELCHYQLP